MGTLVMVLGESGSGKSTSLRNFEPGEVGVFNVTGKPMPFRKQLPQVPSAGYQVITKTLAANNKRAYVVDDAGYLMQFDNFGRCKDTGYGKFTDMAKSFYELLRAAMATDRDTVVYFLLHPDRDDQGREKPKTIGKMLDEKLNVQGLFPIVLDCEVRDGKHVFVSQNDGYSLAKAPMEMLPGVMDNDLKAVDAAIREYWGLKPLTEEKEEPNA